MKLLLLLLALQAPVTYPLTVTHGSGGGRYACGQTVTISAPARLKSQVVGVGVDAATMPPQTFAHWFLEWDGEIRIAKGRVSEHRISIVMPCHAAIATPMYQAIPLKGKR